MNFREIIKQAERGVHQAPTVAGYRHPKISGWKELATTNPEDIRKMAANGYSGCNWVSVAKEGFACIIDIDDVEYAESLVMPVPRDTFIVNTPSGGLHVYLWHTDESVKLGSTNIIGPDGSAAIEFKSNYLTCASPGVERTDKEPHGYYAPANDNSIKQIQPELVSWLRAHGRQKKQYAARASKREFHPSYELEDEIEHYDWHMTGQEKIGPNGVRFIEFSVCPIDDEIHVGMEESRSFKCCLTIGDYGLGFACQAGRHQESTINDVWEACEERGCEEYPYCRYLDEDKAGQARAMLSDPTFPIESADDCKQGTGEAAASGEAPASDEAPANGETASVSTFTYSPDDTGNGDRLVRLYGKMIRFVYETGVWMVWGDAGWEQDTNGQLMRMTKAVIRELVDEAGDDKELWYYAKKSASVSGRKAMIASAAVEKDIITNISQWDRDG